MQQAFLVCVLFVFIMCPPLFSCHPPYYLLFHAEAQSTVDSLSQSNPDNTVFERMVLWHNLAFHKCEKSLAHAEELLDSLPDDRPVIQAYRGSLSMIKVSHRSKASNVFRGIFGKSPYKEARDGFERISQALCADSDNVVIRLLHVTAAVESGDYLPELLNVAASDLVWLDAHVDTTDLPMVFFTHLTWVKYYTRILPTAESTLVPELMRDRLQRAAEAACNDAYRQEVELWIEKSGIALGAK